MNTAIEVENLDWLVPPPKDVHVAPAFAPPWPNPYPDMMAMDMGLDPSFTASLEDSIVDPNLLGGGFDPNGANDIPAAGGSGSGSSFIKEDVSTENSPGIDFLSNSSSSKRMPSLTPDSLPPSLPSPPASHSAGPSSSSSSKKRGRPARQQQQEEQQNPKRRRSGTHRSSFQSQDPYQDQDFEEEANLSTASASPSSPSLSPPKQSSSSSQPQDKRSRIREKNRIAACKCRRKQRKAVNKLTSRHEELEDLNRQLNGQVSELEAEAYVLKNMLMAHGNCGCEMIQQYFRDAAASLVQKVDVGSSLGEGETAGEKVGAAAAKNFAGTSLAGEARV